MWLCLVLPPPPRGCGLVLVFLSSFMVLGAWGVCRLLGLWSGCGCWRVVKFHSGLWPPPSLLPAFSPPFSHPRPFPSIPAGSSPKTPPPSPCSGPLPYLVQVYLRFKYTYTTGPRDRWTGGAKDHGTSRDQRTTGPKDPNRRARGPRGPQDDGTLGTFQNKRGLSHIFQRKLARDDHSTTEPRDHEPRLSKTRSMSLGPPHYTITKNSPNDATLRQTFNMHMQDCLPGRRR